MKYTRHDLVEAWVKLALEPGRSCTFAISHLTILSTSLIPFDQSQRQLAELVRNANLVV